MHHVSDAATAATVPNGTPEPYEINEQGIFHTYRNGERRRLSNFSAEITSVVQDESGSTVAYGLTARLGTQEVAMRVPVSGFEGMSWVSARLGPQATVFPEPQAKNHIITAIRFRSPHPRVIHRITRLGWIELDGKAYFVHAKGTIPELPKGSTVELQLPHSLQAYALPPADGDTSRLVDETLKFLACTTPEISFVLLGCIVRSLMGKPNFAGWLAGATGVGKSVLAALVQAFFGADFNLMSLPQNWSSTGKAIQAHQKLAVDVLTVVDDFVPGVGLDRGQSDEAKCDLVIRGQVNQQARDRCGADGSLIHTTADQGMVLSTGEDLPRTPSILARLIVLNIDEDSLRWDAVSECQELAATGRFAALTAEFIRWLAAPGRRQRMHNLARNLESAWRRRLTAAHARTPANLASVELGLVAFLLFAREQAGMPLCQAVTLLRQGRSALEAVADHQNRQLENSSPAELYISLLRAALNSGRARVVVIKHGKTIPSPNGLPRWCGDRAQGQIVGYYEPGRDAVHLDPTPSVAVAKKMAADAGESFRFATKTIGKRLSESKMLLFQTANRNTYKISIDGQRINVFAIRAEVLFGEDDPPSGPDPAGEPDVDANAGLPPAREAVDLAKLAGKTSGIEWTGHTWNPGAGCTKVSPGCKNCYANELHDRRHRMFQLAQGIYAANGRSIPKQYSQPFSSIQFFPERLVVPGSVKTPTLFFVNSMTDLFHAGFTTDQIHQVLEVMRSTPRHWYQLLTKRPERLLEACQPGAWPKNLLLGVSVEDKAALKRIRPLVESQPSLAWLSIEPLLEDLGQIDLTGISWVVLGGETAAVGRCRPMNPAWVRSVRDQCVNANVPFFFKQWGNLIHESQLPDGGPVPSRTTHKWADGTVSYHVDKKRAGRLLDGKKWDQFPLVYKLDESDVQAE